MGAEPDAIHIGKNDRHMIIGKKILPIDAYPLVHELRRFSLGRISFVNFFGLIIEGRSSAIGPKPDFLPLDRDRINHFAGKTISGSDVLEG
jgi:hypothetical protein